MTTYYPSADTPSAVLLDFGGVLTTSVISAFTAFSTRISNDPKLVLRVLSKDEAARRALVDHEEGRLIDEEFEEIVAASLIAAGATIEAAGLIAAMQADLRPDEDMLALVARLKETGHPVALVSNSFGRDCYSGYDLESLFDVRAISGIEGVRKPSRRLYEIACERVGVSPSSAIMIDDLAQNIESAQRLGMGGIVHTEAPATAAVLADLLGLAGPEVLLPSRVGDAS